MFDFTVSQELFALQHQHLEQDVIKYCSEPDGKYSFLGTHTSQGI